MRYRACIADISRQLLPVAFAQQEPGDSLGLGLQDRELFREPMTRKSTIPPKEPSFVIEPFGLEAFPVFPTRKASTTCRSWGSARN